MPHPALSKGEGSEKCEAKALSFGEDLGEAAAQNSLNLMTLDQPPPIPTQKPAPASISTKLRINKINYNKNNAAFNLFLMNINQHST